MSQLDKLLSNAIDYTYLLRFLHKNYPDVVEEWKIKIIDYRGPKPQQQETKQEQIPEKDLLNEFRLST